MAKKKKSGSSPMGLSHFFFWQRNKSSLINYLGKRPMQSAAAFCRGRVVVIYVRRGSDETSIVVDCESFKPGSQEIQL